MQPHSAMLNYVLRFFLQWESPITTTINQQREMLSHDTTATQLNPTTGDWISFVSLFYWHWLRQ